jgi:hypothetical protein
VSVGQPQTNYIFPASSPVVKIGVCVCVCVCVLGGGDTDTAEPSAAADTTGRTNGPLDTSVRYVSTY